MYAELGIHRGEEKYIQSQHIFPSDDIQCFIETVHRKIFMYDA